ncbi:MAG TPA: lamin tail domain-containing protein [Rhodanobacteraceae bacterium]|nr:lamin tail domain-containing protein [Rhodanobacteraceae bacterium]
MNDVRRSIRRPCAKHALLLLLLLGASAVQAAPPSDLLISEYVEGSASNKAIELYNGTGAAVDLSQYTVELYVNGATTASSTVALSGSLADGAAYVIANSSSAQDIKDRTDLFSGVANFNGDDALVLKHSGTVIDSLGQVGNDPGSEWGTDPVTTKDHTLRRKSSVCAGDTTDNDAFDPVTEWDGYPQNTFDGLGSHSVNCGPAVTSLSIDDVSLAEGNSGTTAFTFTVSLSAPAPAGGVSFDIATSDGSATTADSDYAAQSLTSQSIAAGASSYTFTVNVNGDLTPESDETFTVTVSNVVGVAVADATGQGTIQNDDIPTLAIHDIQGTGDASPYAGQTVHTTGNIVTAVTAAGFFVQAPDNAIDADPQTSEGVYVYTGSAPTVAAGDSVSFDSQVSEYYNLTELTAVANLSIDSSGNTLPTAITFDALTPSPSPALLTCGSSNFECFEGMRVSIANGFVSTGNQKFSTDPYAEVSISAAGSRPLRDPGLVYGVDPSLIVTGDNDAAPIWDGNPEVFEMDADAALPAFAGRAINGGSRFHGVGVITFEFGDYEFQPTELTLDYDAPMPRPVPVADASTLRIGEFNAERFCDSNDDRNGTTIKYTCSGDSSEPNAAAVELKVARVSQYIGDVLKLPDVVGMEEVENITMLQALAAKIQTDYGVTYTPELIEGHDPSGIDVGYLVNSARVTTLYVQQLAATETWNDGGNTAFVHDHPPLLLKGVFHGDSALNQSFMTIVVHLKARSNADDASAAGDRDREKRLRQAWSLAQAVQQLQTTAPTSGLPLTVVGDFNAYEFTDGLVDMVGMISGRYDFAANLLDPSDIGLGADTNVVSPSLWDSVLSLPNDERYSYLYTQNFGAIQGYQARKVPTDQVLDHALLNTAARDMFVRMDYGRADQDAAVTDEDSSTGAIGVSDHDGFVVQLSTDRIFANGFENRD